MLFLHSVLNWPDLSTSWWVNNLCPPAEVGLGLFNCHLGGPELIFLCLLNSQIQTHYFVLCGLILFYRILPSNDQKMESPFGRITVGMWRRPGMLLSPKSCDNNVIWSSWCDEWLLNTYFAQIASLNHSKIACWQIILFALHVFISVNTTSHV